MGTRLGAAVLASLAVGLVAATVLLAGSATAAPLVEDDEECDVTAGESIQAAIDNATPYTEIVVCEATYYQNATITKDGIELLGKGTPILDGSLHTGTRTALRVAEGVDDVTIYSFEIREFDDPLNETDPSSGIVLEGGHTNVTLWGNDIHHNAWTGVRSLTGPITDVTLVDNKFDAHGFSHTFLHQIQNLTLRNNTAVSSDQAFVVSEARNVTIRNNSVRGGGRAAYVFPPPLDNETWTRNVTFANNTADGKWAHGVWAIGLQNASFLHNNFTINGTDLTLGGIPSQYQLYNNSIIEVTTNYTDAYKAFRDALDQTYSSDCTECTIGTIEDLFNDALSTLLNPQADAEDREDLDRLEACEGKGESCLRSQFFHPNDTRNPHEWSHLLQTAWLTDARLHFIDAGTRLPGADYARRLRSIDLDQPFTTLVLCRIETPSGHRPCDIAPHEFDFGLDLRWAQTDRPRHLSKWRMLLPGSGVHDTFDRLHGPDATLFKKTTKPHHRNSTDPPSFPAVNEQTQVGDPNRAERAGNATLECRIVHVQQMDTSNVEDCNDPTLLREPIEPSLAWCMGNQPAHPQAIHSVLLQEVRTAWPWADTCQPYGNQRTTNWSDFFKPSELQDLGAA